VAGRIDALIHEAEALYSRYGDGLSEKGIQDKTF